MSAVDDRLAAIGLVVPPVVVPLGSYLPATRTGSLVFTAGQIPVLDGEVLATGLVGDDISVEQAAELARTCALNALAAVRSLVDDLDRVVQVVKVVGFVASAASFVEQPAVVNGASDLLAVAFGGAGRHARSAVGVASLPRGVPVEVEIVVEVRD